MRVLFRPFAPADLLTIKQAMPFSASENQNGIVAYNADTFETLAVLVAQEWTFNACFVHWVVLDKFVFKHGFIEEIANWLFTIANRKKLYALVQSDNKNSLSVCEKMGFREKVVLEEAVDDGIDFVLLEVKREDCPYWTQPEMAEVVNG